MTLSILYAAANKMSHTLRLYKQKYIVEVRDQGTIRSGVW